MTIRNANINDAKRLSYLIRRNTDQVKENGHTPEQKEAWKAQNTPRAVANLLDKRTIFCAFENNRMIGTIGLENDMVTGLYISPRQRGKGIGQKLLHHLESHAQKTGIKRLHLTSTPNGLGFYKKHGYHAEGPIELTFDGVTFHETIMSKKL